MFRKKKIKPAPKPARWRLVVSTLDGEEHGSYLSEDKKNLEQRMQGLTDTDTKWISLDGELIQRDKIVSMEVKQYAPMPRMY